MATKKVKKSGGSDLDKRLARAFNKHLEGAKEGAKGGGFDEFDDGKYKARLVTAEIGESGSGRLQITFGWKFLTGGYKGQIKNNYQGVETEENMKYALRDLNKLGYETDEIESPADLRGILKELVKEKPKAKISLKTKGEFQNVYILTVEGSDEDEDTDDEDGDDDNEAEEEESEEEEDEEEDEDEKPKKKKTSKKKAEADEEEEEEEDEENEDEDDSDDEDEEEEEEENEDEDEKPKKKRKSSKKSDDDEEEEEEEEEEDGEDVDIAVGSEITYKFKGKKAKGTVLDIFPKENALRVETGGKKRRIKVEAVIGVEVPEEPKKKKKKKK